MLPILLYTTKRIFKHYTGFSFFIFILISKLEKDETRLIRHETIHFWQQAELLFIFHWLLYVIFYLISRLKGHSHYIAYRYNPFELEAYKHDADALYLKKRKPLAWLFYVNEYLITLRKDCSNPNLKNKKIDWK